MPPDVTTTAALQHHAALGDALVDYGRAHAGLGHAPPADGLRVELRGDVIEHYRDDMTVRVAAGCTIARLNEQLAASGQFVPIDADEDVTVGEAIAHHVYGPLRTGFGSVRDLLLGLRYIDGLGRDIAVGGRTVKNVAGLDVTRLLVGSLGELGFVHEATLRTFAVPEQTLTAEVTLGSPDEADVLVHGWLLGDARPAMVSLSCAAGAVTLRWGCLGSPKANAAQLDALRDTLNATQARSLATREADLPACMDAISVSSTWRRDAAALVKLIVPPGVTGETVRQLVQLPCGPLTIDALPTHGCVFVGGPQDADATRTLHGDVTRLLAPRRGLWVWHRRPSGAEDLAPFGPPQPDWSTLVRLKRAMDPRHTLNPGRFLGAMLEAVPA